FKVLDVDASMSRKGVSYSTRTGGGFAAAQGGGRARFQRRFREGVQGSPRRNLEPRPQIMLRHNGLSAATDESRGRGADVGRSDQIKLDQYFTSLRDMENQLAVGLQRPEKREACTISKKPDEAKRGASIDIVNTNTKTMARLLAMAMACNQSRVFNFVH